MYPRVHMASHRNILGGYILPKNRTRNYTRGIISRVGKFSTVTPENVQYAVSFGVPNWWPKMCVRGNQSQPLYFKDI